VSGEADTGKPKKSKRRWWDEGSSMRKAWTIALSLCLLAMAVSMVVPQPPAAHAMALPVPEEPVRPAQVEPEIHISLSPGYFNITDRYVHAPSKTNVTVAITPKEALEGVRAVDLLLIPTKTPFTYFESISLMPVVEARGGWAEVEIDWGSLIYSLNLTLISPPPVGLGWTWEETVAALPYWDIMINVTYVGAGGLTWKAKTVSLVIHHVPGLLLEDYYPWKAPARWMELGMRPKREESIIPAAPGEWRVVGRRFGRQVRNLYWIISPQEAEEYEQAVYLYISPWDRPSELYDVDGKSRTAPLDLTAHTKWGYWIAEANVLFGYWYGYVIALDTTKFPDGVYNVTVEYVDIYDNKMTYTIFICLDNTPPEVEITSPADGATVSGVVEVKFVVNETNPLKATIAVDLAAKELSAGEFDSAGGTNVFTFDSTTLGDGDHTVRIEVEDLAGNTKSTLITIDVENVRGLLSDIYNHGQTVGLGIGATVGLIVGVWISVVITKLVLRKR